MVFKKNHTPATAAPLPGQLFLFPQLINIDENGVEYIVSAGLTLDGKEVPDPVPMEPPIGVSVSDGLEEMVKRVVHQSLSQLAAENDFESFDESEDFDIEDDPLDPHTPYEAVFDPPSQTPSPSPTKAAGEEKSTPAPGVADVEPGGPGKP